MNSVSTPNQCFCPKCEKSKSETEFDRRKDVCLECKELAKKLYYRARNVRRWKEEPKYRLGTTIRARNRGFIKPKVKGKVITPGGKPSPYIGCTRFEYIAYLEKQFQPGMTWENHGDNGREIDHIMPLANFNLSDPEQFLIASHYLNTQPCWKEANRTKLSKLNVEQADSLVGHIGTLLGLIKKSENP